MDLSHGPWVHGVIGPCHLGQMIWLAFVYKVQPDHSRVSVNSDIRKLIESDFITPFRVKNVSDYLFLLYLLN